MKQAHRPDLFVWSTFDASRNLDFHSLCWVRSGGNVVIDPLPLSDHDRAHLLSLGGAASIVITNSDHTRSAQTLARELKAELCGPTGERETFPFACARWLGDGDEVVPGLKAFEFHGSKTKGELALVLEETTLITGDLVRCHAGGRLNLLPSAKLSDEALARQSIARLVRAYPKLECALVGDGWPLFTGAAAQLAALTTPPL